MKTKQDMYRKICTLCLLLLTSFSLMAQQIVVTELPTQQLLPTAHIHRLLQDDENYLWYATEGGGLCRDNGYQIDIFRSPLSHTSPSSHILGSDSLLSNTVTCLAEDKQMHLIWFGTTRGLYCIDKSDYHIHTVSDQRLRHSPIDVLFTATDGSVWASARGEIFRLDSEGKIIGCYPCYADGKQLKVNSFHEDSRHTLRVLCSEEALLQYNAVADSFHAVKWDFPASPTCMVEDVRHGIFWIGTWGKGVVCYIPDDDPSVHKPQIKEQPATQPDSPSSHSREVLNMLQDKRQGLLWVATMDDLYVYRVADGTLQTVSTNTFLPQGKKVLDHPFEDRAGNIWVPGYTPHTFIISFDGDKIDRYPVSATRRLTGYPVMADAVVKEDNYYWIWQGRDNLTLYHPATDRITYAWHQEAEAGKRLRTEKHIEKCRTQAGIWAADGNRLLHLWHEDMTIRTEEKAHIADAGCISALHEANNRLWIGTDNALYELSLLGDQLRKVCEGTGWIKQLVSTSEGDIYVAAGENGFLHVSPQGKTTVIAQGEDYTSVTFAPDGTVWTATWQGSLYSYHPRQGSLCNENSRTRQNGETIKALESDESGHIWILTEQYVKEFNPANNAFRIFRNSDNTIHVEYFHCVRRTEENRVCIGGIGAFCIIPSSTELNRMASAIRPVVTSVTSGGKRWLPGMGQETLELQPKQDNCAVSFSTLDHLHVRHVSYAYRLRGWEEEWTYLPQGSNTAYFSRLPKGTYRLELKATDRYGCWGEPRICLTLHRLPAWHETWWAYLIYIVLAIAIAASILWLFRRIRQLRELQRRRKEVMLNSVEIRAEELSSAKFNKEFLQKAVLLVEQHLADSHYNVEQLSSDLCMSRMNLYRKLQMQTGQSPTEFIRSIRLKKAAMLLADTDMPISEVSRYVGFSTPAYFSKCFKEKFGMLPTHYAHRPKTDETTEE